MREKDRYLGLEFLLTFCLLNISIFMLGESVSLLKPYLIPGLIFGFCFSWFIRNKSIAIMHIIVNIGAVLVCLWIVYSIINSSLFYRELILISIKGVLVLEIVLILGAHLPSFLSYIQVLNIPIFMGSPLFAEGYSLRFMLLAIAYIICYLAILRIKLYASVDATQDKKVKRHYSISIGIILFLISIIACWALFNKFSFATFTKAGLFPEEKITQEFGLAKLEKEYYDLEDEISRRLTKLAIKSNLAQQAGQLLNLFSVLVNEALDIMEVDKAQDGLISRLQTPGPGLESRDAEETAVLIESYVDKKVTLNLKRNKDNISDSLKMNPFNLTEKFSGLNLANRIQYAKTPEEVRESEKKAREMVDGSLANQEIKRQIKDSFRQIKEWKDYDIYRQKLGTLEKHIESLQDPQSRAELAKLISRIEEAQDSSGFQRIDEQLQKSKEAAPEQLKEIISEAQDLLDLKQEISLLVKSKELKEKLEDLKLEKNKLQEFKQQIEAVKNSETVREFVKNSRELKAEFEKEGMRVDNELKKVWENKIDLLAQEEISKARQALKETTLADSGEALLKELEKLEFEDSLNKLNSSTEELQQKVSELKSRGFIGEETKSALQKIIREMKQLVQFKIDNNIRMEAPAEAVISEEKPAQASQEIYLQKLDSLEKHIESLQDPQSRAELAKLISRIKQAQDLSDFKEIDKQLQEIKETVPQRLQEIVNEAEDLLDLKQEISLLVKSKELKEKLEDLKLEKNKLQEIKQQIEAVKNSEALNKLNSSTEELQQKVSELKSRGFIGEETKSALQKIIREMKQLVQFKIDKPAQPQKRTAITALAAVEPTGLISIILSSEKATLSMKDRLDLKAEGYYSDASRRDITSLVNWKNDRPFVIKVRQGRIRPVWFGTAKVRAQYSGVQSLPAAIKVIFTMAWLREVFLKIVSFIILITLIIFTVCFFLVKIKKDKLRAYFHNNPNEFIINLYENFKRIMAVFGLGNKERLPPLAYAGLIEELHSLERGALLKFTVKFEEAKYSNHTLQSDDALDSLNCYNDFLNKASICQNKFSRFYKYCLALVYRTPLAINI